MSIGEEINRIAYAYAQALIELASERDQRSKVQEELQGVEAVLKTNPGFEVFLENPAVPVQDKHKILAKVFEGHVSQMMYHFLKVLANNNRLGWLRWMVRAYVHLNASYDGASGGAVSVPVISPIELAEGTLVTAVELSGEEVASIAQRLSQDLGKEVHLKVKVNPEILGGVKVELQGDVYDISVASDLKRFATELNERLIRNFLDSGAGSGVNQIS